MNALLFAAGILLIFVAIFMVFKQRIMDIITNIKINFYRRRVKSMEELFSLLLNDILDEKSLKIWHELHTKYRNRIRRESNL